MEGWTKIYSAEFIDEEAFSTEAYGGVRTEWGLDRSAVFARQETMEQDGEEIWSGETYVGCGIDGRATMSTFGWAHDIDYDTYEYADVEVDHTEPRTYLPEVEALGTGVSWTFEYGIAYPAGSVGLAVLEIPVSGTYTDEGLTDVEVAGVVYEGVWHISAAYVMELADSGLGFTRDYPAIADFYYGEGVGLVKEVHIDVDTGSVILRKELLDMVWDDGLEGDDGDDSDTGMLGDTGMLSDTGMVLGEDTGVPEDTGAVDDTAPPADEDASEDSGGAAATDTGA